MVERFRVRVLGFWGIRRGLGFRGVGFTGFGVLGLVLA